MKASEATMALEFQRALLMLEICQRSQRELPILFLNEVARGGVEDIGLKAKAKAKDTKKSEAKVRIALPRTDPLEAKDQGHNAVLIPKKSKKKVFAPKIRKFFEEKFRRSQKKGLCSQNSSVLQVKYVFKEFFASSVAFSKTKQNCS